MDETSRALAHQWGFTPAEELPSGHCSRVFADSTRVLKVPFQGEEMTSGFVAALRMSGKSGPVVFESDQDSAVILMERLHPGSKLMEASLPDEEAMEITCRLIEPLKVYEVQGCMPLADYYENPDPLLKELLETTESECFLHGDLHHENILLHGDRWVVIDPKGLVGDPAFETVAFLRNPLDKIPHYPDLEGLTRRRIEFFAQRLNLDPWRICAWSLVDTRSWADTDEWLRFVEVLAKIEAALKVASSG